MFRGQTQFWIKNKTIALLALISFLYTSPAAASPKPHSNNHFTHGQHQPLIGHQPTYSPMQPPPQPKIETIFAKTDTDHSNYEADYNPFSSYDHHPETTSSEVKRHAPTQPVMQPVVNTQTTLTPKQEPKRKKKKEKKIKPKVTSRRSHAGRLKKYQKEVLCVLRKLGVSRTSRTGKRKHKNALHYAKTLSELPSLPATFRRHLYAQYVPETAIFGTYKETNPKCHKITGGCKYKGRGWIQLTHKGNYKRFACFRQKLDRHIKSGAGDLTLTKLSTFTRPNRGKSCQSYGGIVSNPVRQFDISKQNGQFNNDLTGIFYFLNMNRSNSTFRNALKSKTTSAVRIVRRGVNRGQPNSRKVASGEFQSILAFRKISSCF